ncbi:hypothetical protein [Caudoviricetes sp.]|nr:hypothetical protein [Caudoviricetes sp.]
MFTQGVKMLAEKGSRGSKLEELLRKLKMLGGRGMDLGKEGLAAGDKFIKNNPYKAMGAAGLTGLGTGYGLSELLESEEE